MNYLYNTSLISSFADQYLKLFCSFSSAGFFPAIYLIAVKLRRAQLGLERFP